MAALADDGVVLFNRVVETDAKRATAELVVVASSGVWVVDEYSDNHLVIGWSQQKTRVDGTGWTAASVEESLIAAGAGATSTAP